MKTPARSSPSKVVDKRSARPDQASEQLRTSPRKKVRSNYQSHGSIASESTEPTQERIKVKCCGEEFDSNDKRARFRHTQRFPKCFKFGIETGGRKKVHPHSPFKRLEWKRECERKRKKAYRDAQKKKASATEKQDSPSKPSATEKRDTPSKSIATKKWDTPILEDPI